MHTVLSKRTCLVFENFEELGVEGSLARAFLGLSLVGLRCKSMKKNPTKRWSSYLGMKTLSSSESLTAMARFLPVLALAGVGVGGGEISTL